MTAKRHTWPPHSANLSLVGALREISHEVGKPVSADIVTQSLYRALCEGILLAYADFEDGCGQVVARRQVIRPTEWCRLSGQEFTQICFLDGRWNLRSATKPCWVVNVVIETALLQKWLGGSTGHKGRPKGSGVHPGDDKAVSTAIRLIREGKATSNLQAAKMVAGDRSTRTYDTDVARLRKKITQARKSHE